MTLITIEISRLGVVPSTLRLLYHSWRCLKFIEQDISLSRISSSSVTQHLDLVKIFDAERLMRKRFSVDIQDRNIFFFETVNFYSVK